MPGRQRAAGGGGGNARLEGGGGAEGTEARWVGGGGVLVDEEILFDPRGRLHHVRDPPVVGKPRVLPHRLARVVEHARPRAAGSGAARYMWSCEDGTKRRADARAGLRVKSLVLAHPREHATTARECQKRPGISSAGLRDATLSMPIVSPRGAKR